MAFNFTKGTSIKLNEIEYQRFLNRGIPATIFLLFLSVVGTIGNIHTILLYIFSPVMAKYSVRLFIIWLASIDLTTCLFCMPFEVFDIRYSYTFSTVGSCKLFRFLNHIVTVASGCLLTSIAIERYKIIVKNLPVVFAYSQRSNVISVSLVGLSTIFSIPAVICYGLNEQETNSFDLTGKDCTILSEYQSLLKIGVYYSTFVIIGSAGTVVCIVSYERILCKICTQKDLRQSLGKKPDLSSNMHSEIILDTTQVIYTISNGEEKVHIKLCYNKKKKATGSSHNLRNVIQLTISLMISTAITYIGCMLYVSTVMVKILNPNMYQRIDRPISELLFRGYFVNNAAHSILFGLLDRTFRQECSKLYRKVFMKRKLTAA